MQNMRIFTVLLIMIFLTPMILNEAFGQELLITISDAMEDVTFDGKWTIHTEWKRSSLNSMIFDNMPLHLRYAHQGNFIYFLIDFEGDTNLENGKDKAMICLNPKENFNPDEQFCFVAILNDDNSKVIMRTTNSEDFREIERPEGFIAISSASDEHDRYSRVPHSTYEFKIPTELVGRSSEYGFYFAVHEANASKTFTYPSQVESITFDEIPDTSSWAKIVSPDKSLPEFHWIIVVVVSSFTFAIYLSRTRMMSGF